MFSTLTSLILESAKCRYLCLLWLTTITYVVSFGGQL